MLVLSYSVPWPANTGGRIRTARLVDALRSRYAVTVAAFRYAGESYDPPPAEVALLAVDYEEPELVKGMASPDPAVRAACVAALSAPDGEPWLSSCYDVGAMSQALSSLSGPLKAVVVEGTHMARFLDVLPAGPRVLDLMDVAAGIFERRALPGAPDDIAEYQRVRRFESAAVAQADLVLTVSPEEDARARQLLGAESTVVVANGVDVEALSGRPTLPCGPGCLLFVGSMSYRPNEEGALWLKRSVLPRVRKAFPGAHVHVVGRSPTAAVLAEATDDYLVHGSVDDVRPYYGRARVVVVPVLSGGGTRLKVIEAAAAGKAIVSTPLGAEGFGAEPGRHLLQATTDVDFAAAVVSLLDDPARASALGRQARHLASQFDWSTIGARLLSALDPL